MALAKICPQTLKIIEKKIDPFFMSQEFNTRQHMIPQLLVWNFLNVLDLRGGGADYDPLLKTHLNKW